MHERAAAQRSRDQELLLFRGIWHLACWVRGATIPGWPELRSRILGEPLPRQTPEEMKALCRRLARRGLGTFEPKGAPAHGG